MWQNRKQTNEILKLFSNVLHGGLSFFVKLMKMFSLFACVLSFCMCFLKLQCCELSWPPYIPYPLEYGNNLYGPKHSHTVQIITSDSHTGQDQ